MCNILKYIIFVFFITLNLFYAGIITDDFINVYVFFNTDYPRIGTECINWCWLNNINFIVCFAFEILLIAISFLLGFYFFKKNFCLSLLFISFPFIELVFRIIIL